MVATVVAAIPCALLAWKLDDKRREREIVRDIDARIGLVAYDWELVRGGKPPMGRPPGWDWCRKLLGDELFATPLLVWCGDDVADADLALIARLRNIEVLTVGNPVHLGGLGTRKPINTRVTDDGLVHLKRLKTLKSVTFCYTSVTDAGVADLSNSIPGCKILNCR